MNSLNISSYFYRLKITRPVYFFPLFLKGNAAIGTAKPSGRLHHNLSKPLMYL